MKGVKFPKSIYDLFLIGISNRQVIEKQLQCKRIHGTIKVTIGGVCSGTFR